MFCYSQVSQCTLGVKTCERAKHRQPPDSFLLLQVHVELLIAIEFMGVLAGGTVRLVDVDAVVGNVVGW